MSWLRWLLCWIGIHDNECRCVYIPSIDAEVVEGMEVHARCRRCGMEHVTFVDAE